MNGNSEVMEALAAAKPAAFEPTAHPDEALRARDLAMILALPAGTKDGAGRSPHRAFPGRRRLVAGLVALAAAAAVLAADPVLRHDPRPAPAAGTPTTATGAQPADARGFLLAVAERAVRLPSPSGAYRYELVRSSQIQTFGTGGKMGRGPAYTVELSQVTRYWTGASHLRAVTVREAPRFLTPKDRANWRKAGAPGLTLGAPPAKLKQLPPNLTVNDYRGNDVTFTVGYESLTLGQVKRLPADPSRLAARLRAAIRPAPTKQMLFAAAADVLGAPVRPEVRAAAFKVMAGVDGAMLLGKRAVPGGRTGTGVAFRERKDADRVYVVDAATADLLAVEYIARNPARIGVRVPPGTAIQADLTLESGWVDKPGQQP